MTPRTWDYSPLFEEWSHVIAEVWNLYQAAKYWGKVQGAHVVLMVFGYLVPTLVDFFWQKITWAPSTLPQYSAARYRFHTSAMTWDHSSNKGEWSYILVTIQMSLGKLLCWGKHWSLLLYLIVSTLQNRCKIVDNINDQFLPQHSNSPSNIRMVTITWDHSPLFEEWPHVIAEVLNLYPAAEYWGKVHGVHVILCPENYLA